MSENAEATSTPVRVVQRGLWFEEFAEGTIYEHRPGRTVTEADNVLFTTLTMNTQALHLDAAWSATQPGFGGQRLINSMFTLSTIVGLSVAQLTQGTLVANLGFPKSPFPHRCSPATRSTPRPSARANASPGRGQEREWCTSPTSAATRTG